MQHKGFLCEEFMDLICKGQWVLLSFHLVHHATNVRVSPLGVVPQWDRRPRTIYDYYFFLVNLDTIPLAPAESMKFGRALWRIMITVQHADPRLGPIFLSKVDIVDVFYSILLNINDIPKLGLVVPTEAVEPQVIAFPLVLPMGWMQSPPLFTAATGTMVDLANQELQASAPAGSHHLDIVSESLAAVPEFAPSSPSALPTLHLPFKVPPTRPPSASCEVMGRLRR
jgi:hypothetical protein